MFHGAIVTFEHFTKEMRESLFKDLRKKSLPRNRRKQALSSVTRLFQAVLALKRPQSPLGLGACFFVLVLLLSAGGASPALSATVRTDSTAEVQSQKAGAAAFPAPHAMRNQAGSFSLPQKARGKSEGFSSNPFSLTHRDPPGKAAGGTVVYRGGEQEKRDEQEETFSFSGNSAAGRQDDRLLPRRTAFSGGQHTMSQIDNDTPPEMSMTYKMNQSARTRVTVNPQDETSPLYRPVERDHTLNSAGVYMNIDVQPNLQLQVGGEYCELNDVDSAREESARGASVGLKWDF